MLGRAVRAAGKQAAVIDSAAALRDRLADAFPGEQIPLPPHVEPLLKLHGRLPDQRPATCGAYVLTYLLPARGFTEFEGESLAAEDYMAHLARVTIDAREPAASYRFPVVASADPAEQGTSPEGVARAIAIASGEQLASIPIPGRDAAGEPQLEGGRWEALLDLIGSRFVSGGLDILFNYESDQLLAARDDTYNAPTLRRADAAAVIPLDRWGVGHFATLAALWRRPSGERWLVLLNSFKERAFAGCEPQPAELMRRGVVREDGRGGGVLVVLPGVRAEHVTREVEEIGLEVRMWSNGSRAPDDWRWSRGS